MQKDRETDRQAEKQLGSWTERQAARQRDR